ncbi:MAG: 3'-5' exonuclease [Nitrospirales bacterium]|nr:ribonuclease H-like domain-containing protein [Nitrospirales bacterium]
MKVVLDIETLQASREHWADLVGVSPEPGEESLKTVPGDLFDYSEHEIRRQKEEELYQRSAFDGTFSRIVVIGLLVFSDEMEPQESLSWYGENEAELLRRFWRKIGELRPSLWITHNGLGFDLPFLKKRSVIHQIRPPFELNLARFRTDPVYDTMAVWSNWDTRGWVKLDVLARALRVPTKSGSGAQVADMWVNQTGKNVALYCLQDTYVTYACYCRMTYRAVQPQEAILGGADCICVD